MISTDKDDDSARCSLAGFRVGGIDHQRQSFDFVFWRDAEITCDFFDRLLSGCVNFERLAVAFGREVLDGVEF